ncbi:DUF2231 domain-containing protein [Enteractinococcus helveticum]|nr:DUF2231 domain-containing protein [Enteractinococcus helveticum]
MNNFTEFFGLPLHPLLVHAVVVLVPLTVIALLLAQFWPRARRRLGGVVPISALGVAALVPVTMAAGKSLADIIGPLPAVLKHERYAQMLLPWSIGLAVVAVIQWIWFRWSKAALHQAERFRTATTAGVLLTVAVVVVSLGNLTVVILTGHSGSRAVWGDLMP